jgi:hypothetical protein
LTPPLMLVLVVGVPASGGNAGSGGLSNMMTMPCFGDRRQLMEGMRKV